MKASSAYGLAPPRGRPRNKDVDAALLEACIDVLAEDGFGGLSLAKVAKQANSTRAAIYRRWSDKADMAVDAVNRLFELSLVDFTRTGNVVADARGMLRDAVRLLSNPRNCKAIASVVEAAHHVADHAKLRAFVRARRGIVMREILEKGMLNGQLPQDFDLETALDALVGPVFYRFLVLGMPMQENDVDALVAMCLPPSPMP